MSYFFVNWEYLKHQGARPKYIDLIQLICRN